VYPAHRSKNRSTQPVGHRVKLLAAGWVFMTIILVGLLAAWNTGNNLYYLVLALLLSTFFGSFVLGRANLNRLAAEQTYPQTVYQYEQFPVRTVVTNRKRFLPSFLIETDIQTALGSGEHPFMVYAPPRRADTVRSVTAVPRRGLIKAELIGLRSRFPMGLFEHETVQRSPAELLVYPAVQRIHPSILELLSSEGDVPAHRRGDSRDFYGIREYRSGDDSRLICWKISAKHDRLMLREFERHEHRGIMVWFDGYVTDHEAQHELDLFEKGVSFCASLVWHYLQDGYEVGLTMPSVQVLPGYGQHHMHRLMEQLALVEPTPTDSNGRLSARGARTVNKRYGKGRYVTVLVTPDGSRPTPGGLVGVNPRVVDLRDLEF